MLVVVLVLSLVKDSFLLNINGSNVCLTNVTNSNDVPTTTAECCPDYIKLNSTCQECPPGTYGERCKDKCVDGKYGPRCKLDCNCGPRQHCHVAKGCICEDGYTEENCNKECRQGWYGEQCSRVCGCQDDETCHHIRGCIKTECPVDYYGKDCQMECRCNDGGAYGCNRQTGECICRPGWKGSSCFFNCGMGRYGEKCSNFCNCTNDNTCHPASGRCYGYSDDEECPIGFFGDKCNRECLCEKHDGCHRKTGDCICRPGWKGSRCHQKCEYGRYGDGCLQLCNCLNDTCHHVTGTCYDYSSVNNTECPPKNYGKHCNISCHCNNEGICHRLSGQCSCKRGWQGDHCSDACELGYYGQKCLHVCNCGANQVCDNVFGCVERDICGGNITAGNGTLTSPNYPDYYKPDTLCEWRITADKGYLVGLKFHAFNLQDNFWLCALDDYLEIRDGDANAQIIGIYCGERVPDYILSTRNQLYIKFKSDLLIQKTGFNTSFEKVFDYCASDDHGCDHICNGTYGNYTCGCRSGYQLQSDQKKCEECAKGFYGKECQQNCTCDNYVGCHPSSGQCLCLPGWEGENCNRKCEYGRYGENCSYVCDCPGNRVCDPLTGVCYDLKEEAVSRSADASVILVPTAVILLIIILISVLAFLKRRKKRHIYTANQTDSHSKNDYDDINPYDEIPEENLELSVIRGQEIHYLLPIPQEDFTGPPIHVGNDTHTNIHRENLARPLPNPNGVSRADDGIHSKNGNDDINPYDEIPEENLELSVIRGQEIHYLLPIPQEDSTGPPIHVGNDTHTNIHRENLARPLPNPNGVSCADDGNTNPDLTYLTVVGNDYFEPYSTIPNRNTDIKYV